jgi:hypothetical protein
MFGTIGAAIIYLTDESLQPTDIEITPETIEAGVWAWSALAGDEFPESSTTNDEVVAGIFRVMLSRSP